MALDALWLVLGLALLMGGGEWLVRGASSLARRLGVSPLVIGLTVVAFGTSAPELAVNVAAALQGRGELSFGNIVGSNIANVGLIVGCSALVRPLAMHRAVIVREVPMMSLAALATLVMTLDAPLDGDQERIARGDGLVLLLLFSIFLYYTVHDALRHRGGHGEEIPDLGVGAAVGMTLLGVIGLTLGGERTVEGASGLARAFGISEAIIGLTIVAVGTSLPELVTSLIGVRRGQTDLAVGNVVGSNIFNLLFVLGITASIRPLPVPPGGHADLVVVLGLSLALLPLAGRSRHIPRWGGALLLATYVLYIGWRALG